MSLRLFHILFIVLSVALSATAGGWGIQRWLREGSGSGLALGILFLLCGVALVVYGSRYFRKLKDLER